MNESVFLDIIRPSNCKDSPFRIGKIPSTYTRGNPTVQFDGESAASTKGYPCLGAYTPAANDRVLLAKVGNGYVILDKIKNII